MALLLASIWINLIKDQEPVLTLYANPLAIPLFTHLMDTERIVFTFKKKLALDILDHLSVGSLNSIVKWCCCILFDSVVLL